MRTILWLLWRQLLFWSVASFVAFTVLCAGPGDPGAWARLCASARSSLLLAAMAVMGLEWVLLGQYLRALERLLKKAGHEVPARAERLVFELLVPIIVAVGFLVQARWFLRHGTLNPNLPATTLVWTLAAIMFSTLILGGFSVIRARLIASASGLAVPRPTTAPWAVALFCGPALLLAYVGLPDPSTVGSVGTTLIEVAMFVTLAVAAEIIDQVELAERPDTGRDVELLLELGPDDHIVEVLPILIEHEAEFGRAFPKISRDRDPDLGATWVVRVPTEHARRLTLALRRDHENVDHVELNALVHASPMLAQGPCGRTTSQAPVNDPLASGQWALQTLHADAVLRALRGWKPQRRSVIAVLDTGVNGLHEDLRAVMKPIPVADDAHGHGTGVAGAAASVADNGVGIASLNRNGAWMHVRSYPALAGRRPAADDVARAVLDAMEDEADVILMAFGGKGEAPAAVRNAIGQAVGQGTLIVAAAGNGGEEADQWPANISGVLAVGASGPDGHLADFSNRVDHLDLAVSAPGVGICTSSREGGYELQSGTSIAAGLVAGVGAHLRALCPALNGKEIAHLMVRRAAVPVVWGHPRRLSAARAIVALYEEPRCLPTLPSVRTDH